MPGRLQRLHSLNTANAEGRPRPRLKPRGIPPALAPHGIYATDDPLEAALYGRDLLGSHRIRVTGAAEAFQATFHAVLFRDITLGHLDFGTEVEVEVPATADNHLILVPANGSCRVTSGSHPPVAASPVLAAVPTPGAPLRLEVDAQSALVVLRIDADAMQVHLSRLLGHTLDRQLAFAPELDLAQPSASRWNFAVQMLHAELFDQGSLLHRGVGVGQLEEFMMSSLLYTVPSTFSEELGDPNRFERRAVRLAREFIEQNLSRPLTVGEIAEAAGVGVRTLQSFFAEDLQQTPMAFVRSLRLDRARADLADTAPGSGVTVTEIASRWGFTHLGRFATSYAHRFGESPSQTLRH